jgi:hypothetical protein
VITSSSMRTMPVMVPLLPPVKSREG